MSHSHHHEYSKGIDWMYMDLNMADALLSIINFLYTNVMPERHQYVIRPNVKNVRCGIYILFDIEILCGTYIARTMVSHIRIIIVIIIIYPLHCATAMHWLWPAWILNILSVDQCCRILSPCRLWKSYLRHTETHFLSIIILGNSLSGNFDNKLPL